MEGLTFSQDQMFLIVSDGLAFLGTKAIFKFLGVNKIVTKTADVALDAIAGEGEGEAAFAPVKQPSLV